MDEQERLATIEAALDQMPMLVAVTEGAEQRLVTINALGRAIVGERPIDTPLSKWADLLGDQLLERYQEAWQSGTVYSADEWRFEFEGPDGLPVERYISFTIAPVRRDAAIRAVVGIGHDVTELVQAREAERSRSAEMEKRHRRTADLLAELQDAMLPKGLPVPQGVELAARYLPAEDYGGAGGDWFDAIPLADGRVVVAVGDVVGHGVEASVVMGELRTLFDERVREDGDLVAALQALDRRARRTGEARSATICAVLLDPATGDVSYCTAGHPPPVLMDTDGGTSYLPATGAGPLASGSPFDLGRWHLDEGDVLLLYSDGLVERPGRTPSQNTVELLQVVGGARGGAGPIDSSSAEQVVERVCRRTLELLTRVTGYADDITLLAMQRVAPVPHLELGLPAVPDAVRTARHDVDDWMARLRVSDLDRIAVQHALTELVANAVEHAYPRQDVRNPVRVEVRLSTDGMLDLAVSDDGAWREPADGEGGRGLALASGFLDEFRVEHDGAGTRARGRHRLSRPALLLQGSAVGPAAAAGRTCEVSVADDQVHVTGEVDRDGAEFLVRAISRSSRGGSREVTVHLADVDLLTSRGVQVLFDARAAGPVLLVAPMGSAAQHVLELVRLPYRTPA